MQMPNFGQNQNQNQQYYQQPQAEADTKKKLLILGGVGAVIILLLLLIFGGSSKAGQQDLQSSIQATSESLAIIDTYQKQIQYTPTKNDLALTQILLRGNLQKLDALYIKTYKSKKNLSTIPKLDAQSKASLDQSARNNTLDSDIITVLKPKIDKAKAKLTLVKPSFGKQSSKQSIQTSIDDLTSIQDLMSRTR